MKRSNISPLPQFFDRYIKLVEDIELIKGLEEGLHAFDQDIEMLKHVGNKKYAPEKWTTKEVIQHITDNERVQSYRALRIARNDLTPLPGYEQDIIAKEAMANGRDISDLLDEFKYLRQSNIILFKGFTDDMLQRIGECSGVAITPLALGFVLIGHQLHHQRILREKYFPL